MQLLGPGISGWHNLDRRAYGHREPKQRSPGYPYSGCTSLVLSLLIRAPDDRRGMIQEERKRRRCFHRKMRRQSCKRGTCGHRGCQLGKKAPDQHAGPEGAPRPPYQRRLEKAGASQVDWSGEI